MSERNLWVDGDSCPVRIRNVVLNASKRPNVHVRFVADRALPIEDYAVEMTVVTEGITDDYLIEHVSHGDIVVTRDVRLTAELAHAGVVVIDDVGNRYTAENVSERLSVARYMESLRKSGVNTTGAVRKAKDPVHAFAAVLDAELVRS